MFSFAGNASFRIILIIGMVKVLDAAPETCHHPATGVKQ
jgi:hypothetical protein